MNDPIDKKQMLSDKIDGFLKDCWNEMYPSNSDDAITKDLIEIYLNALASAFAGFLGLHKYAINENKALRQKLLEQIITELNIIDKKLREHVEKQL